MRTLDAKNPELSKEPTKNIFSKTVILYID